MPKFFVPPENVKEDQIVIDSADVTHITRVLRCGEGDRIRICDTCGYDYEAVIQTVEEKKLICGILSKEKSDTEPALQVTLYQGLPKASKMDYIIQKTTELGISRIIPVSMARCVVKLENRKAEEKKTERWRKISEEAAKQSGRGIIPEITLPMPLAQAVADMKQADLAFAPYECEESATLRPVLLSKKNPRTVSFIIGPEGGFDPAEIDALRDAGVASVTLGKRILRTETAGEAVLSMVMYEIGDING